MNPGILKPIFMAIVNHGGKGLVPEIGGLKSISNKKWFAAKTKEKSKLIITEKYLPFIEKLKPIASTVLRTIDLNKKVEVNAKRGVDKVNIRMGNMCLM